MPRHDDAESKKALDRVNRVPILTDSDRDGIPQNEAGRKIGKRLLTVRFRSLRWIRRQDDGNKKSRSVRQTTEKKSQNPA